MRADYLHLRGLILLFAILAAACNEVPAPSLSNTAGPNPNAAATANGDDKTVARAAIVAPNQTNVAPAASLAATSDNEIDTTVHVHRPDAQGFTELDWLAMMPPDELDALQSGSTVIVHNGKLRQKQFGSYRVMSEVLGRKIKLPGYVVPIESDDKGNMTEFFFVPFFGACIHVPPPPPNQIVYVRLAKPTKAPEIWDAFMLKGELSDQKVQNRVAGSAYSMDAAVLEPYRG